MNNSINALSAIDRGRAIIQLDDAMTAVAKAVKELHVSGKVTITLTFKPSGETVDIFAAVTSKVPKPALKGATFFVDDEGQLTRDDPAQEEFPAITKLDKQA